MFSVMYTATHILMTELVWEQLQTIETCSESSACLSPKAGQSGIGGLDQRWEGDNQVEGLQNMTNLMKLVKFSLEALKRKSLDSAKMLMSHTLSTGILGNRFLVDS